MMNRQDHIVKFVVASRRPLYVFSVSRLSTQAQRLRSFERSDVIVVAAAAPLDSTMIRNDKVPYNERVSSEQCRVSRVTSSHQDGVAVGTSTAGQGPHMDQTTHTSRQATPRKNQNQAFCFFPSFLQQQIAKQSNGYFQGSLHFVR